MLGPPGRDDEWQSQSGVWGQGGLILSGVGLVCGVACGLACGLMPPRALAHQTQISDRVGGTHHIEPNDTPRAGEKSLTWFGLTQLGGSPIGLSDCDCRLELYDGGQGNGRQEEALAIATPPLMAIDVEGLEDVPAAEVVFPKVGAYVLSLTGRPKAGADFPRFQLDFPVTVAAGPAQATPRGEAEASSPTAASPGAGTQGEGQGRQTSSELAQTPVDKAGRANGLLPLWSPAVVLLVAALGLLWQVRRS